MAASTAMSAGSARGVRFLCIFLPLSDCLLQTDIHRRRAPVDIGSVSVFHEAREEVPRLTVLGVAEELARRALLPDDAVLHEHVISFSKWC